jgi:hypothetical protein
METPPPTPPPAPSGDHQVNQWAMGLHLSQLAGYVIPMAGLVVPIVIWQVKKNDMPAIDAHGKVVANWLISAFIYGFACFLLTFVVIGIPLLIALCVCCVVFPIIGGVKASSGQVWKYPTSINFLK